MSSSTALHPWINPLRKLELGLLLITAPLLAWTCYYIFMVVPNERVMGAVQRIFYFHVGSAIAAYCAFALVLIAALGFLSTRKLAFDVLLQAAGEVALVFCSIVLTSGMIWGHSAWNTWFRWEPRLVTFLLLWLLALALNILRMFGNKNRVAAHCSVLGILGALTVPLVVFSIKLMPGLVQLHPVVVENRGLKDPSFVTGMFLGMGTLVLLQFLLIALRTRIGFVERQQKE